MIIELIPLQQHGDERGLLVALEEQHNIPFTIKRVYYLYDTQQGIRRGFHAHKKTRQMAIAVKGSCMFHFDDGVQTSEILLDNPAKGLMIEPNMWHEMYNFSDDCILMVLADDIYDESDYIRNYEDFIGHIKNENS
ncbi:sugar 3,4-ketoisomerase [Enterobacter cloacae]|jgi:dTDP-4-dehydrorhamnose 3,5-epimerase-like enzyme|uniref:sugar 3,4-ketoisomerase n=2 Tax=Enterobacter cloacae TaxID=550 RepID=UPI0007B31C4C|nr:FdtA/QdtA family cupin domain-containing protein [Enterobacter cloacae]ELQ9012888.1 WxcM-like domain-containing protein [Enterobacter cloacae]KZQ41330.1 dTDP-6-deoxy-3,4-keto-hexulose isomerase [Enterobacter cloacae subsp. dissolvens]MBG0521702.1 WxcM-like domain-containing protein [Enterobacter cloacae]MBW4195085.1 WxcM-like domain-containing protein [Enterobacter cloacae subsp. cloacae]MCE1971569.1 FdtA/QdtA family cupin domain-containing protein [Enterobacter cloacae]